VNTAMGVKLFIKWSAISRLCKHCHLLEKLNALANAEGRIRKLRFCDLACRLSVMFTGRSHMQKLLRTVSNIRALGQHPEEAKSLAFSSLLCARLERECFRTALRRHGMRHFCTGCTGVQKFCTLSVRFTEGQSRR
jgi:hypothetical protein